MTLFPRIVSAGAACVITALLVSCSSSGDASVGDEFQTVEGLRDSFVAAGGDCGDWSPGTAKGLWAQWGTCRSKGAEGESTLSTYTNGDNLNEVLDSLKESAASAPRAFVGSNWIIATGVPESVGVEMGATVVDLGGDR